MTNIKVKDIDELLQKLYRPSTILPHQPFGIQHWGQCAFKKTLQTGDSNRVATFADEIKVFSGWLKFNLTAKNFSRIDKWTKRRQMEVHLNKYAHWVNLPTAHKCTHATSIGIDRLAKQKNMRLLWILAYLKTSTQCPITIKR